MIVAVKFFLRIPFGMAYLFEGLPLLCSFAYGLLRFILERIQLRGKGKISSDISNSIFANAFCIEVFLMIVMLLLSEGARQEDQRWIWLNVAVFLVLFVLIIIWSKKGFMPFLHRNRKDIARLKAYVRGTGQRKNLYSEWQLCC